MIFNPNFQLFLMIFKLNTDETRILGSSLPHGKRSKILSLHRMRFRVNLKIATDTAVLYFYLNHCPWDIKLHRIRVWHHFSGLPLFSENHFPWLFQVFQTDSWVFPVRFLNNLEHHKTLPSCFPLNILPLFFTFIISPSFLTIFFIYLWIFIQS